jgi:hypothetical protein
MASSEFSSPSVTLFVFAACSATAWRDGLAVSGSALAILSRIAPRETLEWRSPRHVGEGGGAGPVPEGALFVRAVEAATPIVDSIEFHAP